MEWPGLEELFSTYCKPPTQLWLKPLPQRERPGCPYWVWELEPRQPQVKAGGCRSSPQVRMKSSVQSDNKHIHQFWGNSV